MTNEMINIAVAVLARGGQERPLDTVLREVLRDQRGLSRPAAGEISAAVFAHQRWRGWLDLAAPVEEQLAEARDWAARFREVPENFSEGDLRRAVPEWIGSEVPVTLEWLRSLQTEPRLWLRARLGAGRSLAGRLGPAQIADVPLLADAVEFQGSEDLFRTTEFHAGEFELQDIASQAVGLWCAPAPGETWWDACAGEGGKLLHLSELMQNKGLLWASDRAEWRLKKLKLRTKRAQCFNYRAALWDGGAKLPTKTKFDGVLLDAPCSGVGTWQRNPHARWTTTPADVAELAAVQGQLLERVAGSVKPGGRLIYSVCTLTRAETVAISSAFTGRHPEFEPLALGNPFAPPENAAATQCWWPQLTGGNGMFVAAWRRRAVGAAPAGRT